MAEKSQELHKSRVCNNPGLHTSKSCNCFATVNATVMQQDSIKARALAVLRRNKEGNSHATRAKEACNNSCNKTPKVALKVASKSGGKLHEMSMDFVWFCLSHENTYLGGHCPVKRSKQDSLTNCVGWQLKQGKMVIQ